VTECKRLIAALQDILGKLELMEAANRNEGSIAEIKRILDQRIQDLEKCASISAGKPGAAKAANRSE